MTPGGKPNEVATKPGRLANVLDRLGVRMNQLEVRAWLAFFGLLAFLRSPYILLAGRFWAEEGSTYFAHAYSDGGIGSLGFVYQRAGYLHLFANVGTWLATLVPLAAAPLMTAWLAYLVVFLLLWMILAWPSELLPSRASRLAAAGLLLFGPVAEPEVWLNTINAQTYLGLVAIILLFVRIEDINRVRYGLSMAALLIAGLSGLYAAILAPLFVLRAYMTRTVRTTIHALVLSGAAIVQGAVIVLSQSSGSLVETKFVWPGLTELTATLGGLHLTSIFIGRQESARLVESVYNDSSAALISVLLMSVLVVLVIGRLVRGSSVRVLGLLLAAFVLTEALVQIGSHGSASSRYTVVPVAIASLALSHGAGLATSQIRRGFALGVIIVALLAGLAEFWTHSPSALTCLDCPDWQQQIEQWQLDPSRDIAIWPYPRWTMTLP